MIPLINHDSQWGRSEVVIIYPDLYPTTLNGDSQKVKKPQLE